MALEPVPTDQHPSRIELEDYWFAQQPQPAGAPGVQRDAADLLEIGEHLRACERCGSALQGLEDERREFLAAYPMDAVLGEVSAAAPAARPWRRVAVLAAVLMLGFFLGWAVRQGGPDAGDPAVRAKGDDAALTVLSEQGGRWEPGAVVAHGDAVRFAVRLSEPGYPLLVVVQEDGARSLAYPVEVAGQERIPGGREVVLPGGARLDGYAGREDLWMWVGEAPWTVDALDEAVTSMPWPDVTAPLRGAP